MREGYWIVGRGLDVGRLLHRISNPAVIALLESRFHILLSGSHTLLTVTGRRSGRKYRLPVQYATDGDTIYVVPGGFAHKTWWRNLTDPAVVQVRLRGRDLTGIGQALSGERDPEAVEAALRVYLTQFATSARVRGIERDRRGQPDTKQLQRAVPNEVIVRVILDKPPKNAGTD